MLIGFCGCKGVGKDTAGNYLCMNFDFERKAFADKLKEAVANLFGMTIDEVDLLKSRAAHVRVSMAKDSSNPKMPYTTTVQLLYWREFLQRFGTEMGRETFGQDFWIRELEREYDPRDNIVITDVRFDNEARWVHKMNGYLIEITRPGHEPDGHASEDPIDEDLIDCLITNTGDLEDLYEDLDTVMEDIRVGHIT